MSWQIIEQGGDYAMALKGNQGTLHDDVSTFLDDPKAEATTTDTTADGDHGRIETRSAVVSSHIDWLQEQHQWPGLEAVAKVTRIRESADKTSSETAYYLLSQPLTADRFNSVARAHWGVENRLHWCLDVQMDEDRNRTRKDNGPQNLAVLRHMALNVFRKDPRKDSLRAKFKIAAWNNDYLTSLLAQFRNAIALQGCTDRVIACRSASRRSTTAFVSSASCTIDLGYIDPEQRTPQTIDNPFGSRLSPMS